MPGEFQRQRAAPLATLIEILTFIDHVNVWDLWAQDVSGMEIFNRSFSYKSFQFSARWLRFDYVETPVVRKETDKLTPIREFSEDFLNNCQKCYTVGKYITIDEKLETFRG